MITPYGIGEIIAKAIKEAELEGYRQGYEKGYIDGRASIETKQTVLDGAIASSLVDQYAYKTWKERLDK